MHLERARNLVERYVALLVEHDPTEATAHGDHTRDTDLPELTDEAVDRHVRAVTGLLGDVEAAAAGIPADPTADDREAAGDLELLRRDLVARRFWLDTRPSLRRDPLAALGIASGGLHELLRRTDLPPARQAALVRAAVERVAALPRFLEQAGQLLESSPAPHLDVAVQRCRGMVPLVREVVDRTASFGGDVVRAGAAADEAVAAIESYAAFLDEFADEPPAPWRFGDRDHAVVLSAALGTDMPAEEIARRAEAALATAREELAEAAGAAWAAFVGSDPVPDDTDERIRRLLDAVADQRAVTRAGIVGEARLAVEEARAFAVSSGLTDVPPAELLTITEVPPFLQGVAVAFISAVPALEPDSGCVYYVSPVPDRWDEPQATSFLREYHAAALRSLAIHEGYPGHFVQLAHAGRHPRLARRLVVSPAFAEGWAVYIERLAILRGFGDLAYRVTQLKMALRIASNALLDVGLHTGDLDDDGARAMLVGGAFQEQQEADGKLVRGKVTAGQLSSYFVGGEEMWQLRHDEEARLGPAFDEVAFHQRVLSHGTPTMGILRAAMADPAAEVRRPFGHGPST